MNGRSVSRKYNYSLALFVLGCAYFAFAPLSALAQGAGGRGVSVTVNPTTGYTVINSQTIGTPRGTTVGPSGGVPSVTVRPPGVGGGLSQTLPAGIEITGIRENAQTLRGPLGATINASASALKNGAVRCLTSFRCNTALGLGATGLQALFDGLGWVMDEGSQIQQRSPVSDVHEGAPEGYSDFQIGTGNLTSCTSSSRVCVRDTGTTSPAGEPYYNWCWAYNNNGSGSLPLMGFVIRSNTEAACYYGGDGYNNGPTVSPVPRSDIPAAVDQHYSPDPSDWNWLTRGLDFTAPDVTIDITDVPVLDGSNEPNFIEWSDGTSRGTFNTYTPTVTNNGSHKPEISVKDEQTEISYDNQGNPTGSSTSTTNTPPSTSTGGGGAPAAEVPTDCDFMPTVCWFIDWFTEPDPSPDPDQEIRDLVQVYEDGGREVSVGSESGTCPPPRTIELSLVPSVEFSFQPFCDLATAVRFWLLAIASFGAAYMTVRSI